MQEEEEDCEKAQNTRQENISSSKRDHDKKGSTVAIIQAGNRLLLMSAGDDRAGAKVDR